MIIAPPPKKNIKKKGGKGRIKGGKGRGKREFSQGEGAKIWISRLVHTPASFTGSTVLSDGTCTVDTSAASTPTRPGDQFIDF